jgi:hypothetical protein
MTRRWIDPSLWASRKPFGIGQQRPNNYLEIWRAIAENRDRLDYAWRILDSLGIADGDPLVLTSDVGEYRGHAVLAPVKTRTLQVHGPEGEVLIDHVHRAAAGVPDYNAGVTLNSALDADRCEPELARAAKEG